MRKVIIIFLFSLASIKIISQSSPLKIDLRIERIYYLYSSELVWEGNVCITNNTNKTIKFPKSFDLELTITDTKGDTLKKKPEVMFEYKNLITLKRRQIIKPNHSFNTDFSEWRTFAFPLVCANKYFVHYSLISNFYPDLMSEFGERTISSNKVLITIPGH